MDEGGGSGVVLQGLSPTTATPPGRREEQRAKRKSLLALKEKGTVKSVRDRWKQQEEQLPSQPQQPPPQDHNADWVQGEDGEWYRAKRSQSPAKDSQAQITPIRITVSQQQQQTGRHPSTPQQSPQRQQEQLPPISPRQTQQSPRAEISPPTQDSQELLPPPQLQQLQPHPRLSADRALHFFLRDSQRDSSPIPLHPQPPRPSPSVIVIPPESLEVPPLQEAPVLIEDVEIHTIEDQEKAAEAIEKETEEEKKLENEIEKIANEWDRIEEEKSKIKQERERMEKEKEEIRKERQDLMVLRVGLEEDQKRLETLREAKGESARNGVCVERTENEERKRIEKGNEEELKGLRADIEGKMKAMEERMVILRELEESRVVLHAIIQEERRLLQEEISRVHSLRDNYPPITPQLLSPHRERSVSSPEGRLDHLQETKADIHPRGSALLATANEHA